MEYDKKYVLKCEKNIAADTANTMKSFPDCNIRGSEVIVKQAGELGRIFAKLQEAGINVIDLEIRQKSLYDFFKMEDWPMNWESESVNLFLYFALNLFDLGVILRYFNRLLEPSKQKRLFRYTMYFLFLVFFTLLIKSELKYSNMVAIALWSCLFLPAFKGEKRNKFNMRCCCCGWPVFHK